MKRDCAGPLVLRAWALLHVRQNVDPAKASVTSFRTVGGGGEVTEVSENPLHGFSEKVRIWDFTYFTD